MMYIDVYEKNTDYVCPHICGDFGWGNIIYNTY